MHILIKLVMLDHYLFELNNKQRTQNSCIYLPPQKEEQKQPSYSIACSDFHVQKKSPIKYLTYICLCAIRQVITEFLVFFRVMVLIYEILPGPQIYLKNYSLQCQHHQST